MKYIFLFLLLCFGNIPAQETVFRAENSQLNIPVRFPLQELSNLINKNTENLLYQDDSFTDNNNDQLKLKVWKSKAIRVVVGTENNLLVEVPLKIWAEKGIGSLGIYKYQEISFETLMYFDVGVRLQGNWTVQTQTKSRGYKWVEKPILDFGAIKIPITSLVEKSLTQEQEKFCKTIDQQLSKELNFQKSVLDAWNAFCQPILVDNEYNTWLKISPKSIFLSPLQFYKDQLKTNIGVLLLSETFIGEKPKDNPKLVQLPNFELKEITDQKIQLITTASIPIPVANTIAEKQLLNKEYDFRKGKIKIVGVKVFPSDAKINIQLETEGEINGVINISGNPIFDSIKRKIVLTNTQFQLTTRNLLQKAAVFFFKKKIIQTIEQDYGIPTAAMETAAKEKLEINLNKKMDNGIKFQGKVLNIEPRSILVTDQKMVLTINTQAMLSLTIENRNN